MNHDHQAAHSQAFDLLLVFGILLIIYIFTMAGHHYSVDGMAMYQQSKTLLFQHTLRFSPPFVWDTYTANYTLWPEGFSLVYLVPLTVFSLFIFPHDTTFRVVPNSSTALFYDPSYMHISISNSILTALSASCVCLIARQFRFPRNSAVACAAVYGLASPAFAYQKQDFSQPLATFLLVASVSLMLKAYSSDGARKKYAIPEHKTEYFGKDLEAMSCADNYRRWILAEFLPYLRGSVAEVGAGVGSFSKLILEADVSRLTAFEPAGNMYTVLHESLQCDKRAQAVNAFFAHQPIRQCFDSIVYINVLEHIKDDGFELSTVHATIAPQGHLLLFVPALPWLYSDFDRQIGHFRRYTKHSLTNLVEQAGFSVVKARYFDLAGIFPWYIHFTLLKNSMSKGCVALYDRLVVPGSRLAEKNLVPPLGKNLLVVARKA